VASTLSSDGSSGEVPQAPRVVLYFGSGCHLCETAASKLAELREELGFELVEIPIDGDRELEARYRELIPVVEIDGERASTYYVQPVPFRRRLAAAQAAAQTRRL
jgi:thiol-disulfide isomerase/thioredoxin